MGRDNINAYRLLCALITNNRNDLVCVLGEESGGSPGV